MKRRPTYAELKAQQRECKAALVAAHRRGDWETAIRYSQVKERIKRLLRWFCPICGDPKTDIARRCMRCYWIDRLARAAACFLLVLSAFGGNTNALHLAWDHGTNQLTDDLQFIIYQSTNVTVPLTNWSPAYVLSATNLSKTLSGTNWTYTATMTNSPSVWFFYATCTNEWGESDPSNLLGTSPPLVPGNNLRISR